MATWSKDFLYAFIQEFRDHPSLWKIKSKEYHNRKMKERAYSALIQKVTKAVDSRATKDTILKKINNIRSAFRKEHKKVLKSKRSGAGIDDIYTPKLWYYSELLFLVDQEEKSEGSSNIDPDSEAEDSEETRVCKVENTTSLSCLVPPSDSNFNPETVDIAPNAGASGGCAFRRNNDSPAMDQILTSVSERLVEIKKEDRFDVFAKNVAAKLRALQSNEQRIFAEKMINEALFEAELGSLTRYCSLNTGELTTLNATSYVPSDSSNSNSNQFGQYY